MSDEGTKQLKAGIAATAVADLCQMLPISLLMLVTMGLIDQVCEGAGLTLNGGVVILMAVALAALIFLTQWVWF